MILQGDGTITNCSFCSVKLQNAEKDLIMSAGMNNLKTQNKIGVVSEAILNTTSVEMTVLR